MTVFPRGRGGLVGVIVGRGDSVPIHADCIDNDTMPLPISILGLQSAPSILNFANNLFNIKHWTSKFSAAEFHRNKILVSGYSPGLPTV